MLVNGSLSAALFCINDNFVQECLVACFTDILNDSREQPESIVCSVRGMTCFLSVYAVLVVLIGASFVTCIVVELNERQTAAV